MSVTNTHFDSFPTAFDETLAAGASEGHPSTTSVLETVLQAGVFFATASLPVTIAAAGLFLGR